MIITYHRVRAVTLTLRDRPRTPKWKTKFMSKKKKRRVFLRPAKTHCTGLAWNVRFLYGYRCTGRRPRPRSVGTHRWARIRLDQTTSERSSSPHGQRLRTRSMSPNTHRHRILERVIWWLKPHPPPQRMFWKTLEGFWSFDDNR